MRTNIELALFVWLVIISTIYIWSIHLITVLTALDAWFFLLSASSLFSLTLVYFCRSQKWRHLIFVQPLVVLLVFLFWSPVKPFINVYFSLHPNMTLEQVRAAVRQNYVGTSFPIPREENWQLSAEEIKAGAGLSKKIYWVEHMYPLDCDSITVRLNSQDKVISARYSSPLVPRITSS